MTRVRTKILDEKIIAILGGGRKSAKEVVSFLKVRGEIITVSRVWDAVRREGDRRDIPRVESLGRRQADRKKDKS